MIRVFHYFSSLGVTGCFDKIIIIFLLIDCKNPDYMILYFYSENIVAKEESFMPLVNAKCTNCGATLTVDDSKEAAICQYCNSAYIVEKAINNYNITNRINANIVNIYNQENSDNRWKNRIDDARNEMYLGDYNSALEIYKQLSLSYPREHLIWKEYMLCFFEKQLKEHKFSDINMIYYRDSSRAADVRRLHEIIRRAKVSCPKESIDSLNQTINTFFNRIYTDTLNGDFDFLSCYKEHYVLEKSFEGISEMHPLMKKLSEDCIAITDKLKQINIHFGYPAHKGDVSFWTNNLIPKGMTANPVTIVAIVGRECIWYYQGHPYREDNKEYRSKLPFAATDEPAFYEKVKSLSFENLQNITTCPFCERGTIKKKLFGNRVCSNCKQIIPQN